MEKIFLVTLSIFGAYTEKMMGASLLGIAPIWLQSSSESDVIKCHSVCEISFKNVFVSLTL